VARSLLACFRPLMRISMEKALLAILALIGVAFFLLLSHLGCAHRSTEGGAGSRPADPSALRYALAAREAELNTALLHEVGSVRVSTSAFCTSPLASRPAAGVPR
jgi:hypothetical protein